MNKLLKADLFRIRKSKLSFISLILAVAVPLFIVLMYFGINKLFNSDDMGGLGFDLFNVRTMFASSYSLTDNVGLVLPIFSAIFVSLDVTNGTLRNKVIVGESRTRIYLSHLISAILFNVLIITLYAAFTMLFGFIFFDWGVELKGEEVTRLIYIIIIGTLSYVYVASITTFLSLVLNSTAPAIIFTVLYCLVLGIACSVIQLINYESFKYLVYLIPTFSNGTSIIINPEINNVMFFEGLASLILFTALNTVVGITLFKKKELK